MQDHSMHDRWEERYQTGNLPWDTGNPDKHLMQLVKEQPIPPCKALEIGCGTGTNAVWLATQGFEVTGADISPSAVNMARAKAQQAGATCTFTDADILRTELDEAAFGFVFDRGCFHSFGELEARTHFAEVVFRALDKAGIWFSLIGNADDPPREVGPPRLSAQEIVMAVEPRFEILSLASIFFDSTHEVPPRAWAVLMRKRTIK